MRGFAGTRHGSVAAVAALCAALALLPAPAFAAGKTMTKRFVAQATPMPSIGPASTDPRACSQGEDGVNNSQLSFTAPAAGRLQVDLTFTGDWDLSVRRPDGRELAQSTYDQTAGGATPEESVLVNLRRGQTVSVVACNWLGTYEARGVLTFSPGTNVSSVTRPR